MAGAGKRLLQNVPGQYGAFDPHGIFHDTPERDQVTEALLLGLDVALHHAPEPIGQPLRLWQRLPRHGLGEHRGACLADGASLALEGDAGYAAVGEVSVDGDLVSAKRVVLLAGQLRTGQDSLVPGALVVVQDDFLVQLIERQRTPPPSRATRSARPRLRACCTRRRMPESWQGRRVHASGSARNGAPAGRTPHPGRAPGPGRADGCLDTRRTRRRPESRGRETRTPWLQHP